MSRTMSNDQRSPIISREALRGQPDRRATGGLFRIGSRYHTTPPRHRRDVTCGIQATFRQFAGLQWEGIMRHAMVLASSFASCLMMASAACAASYTAMAPLAQYMMASPADEIALARSAAPSSISSDAEILVLGP